LWQVVEVAADEIVDLGGKIKFPRGRVLLTTPDTKEATDLVLSRAPAETVCHYGTATAGDGGTATAGYGGTATAGDRGTATAGDRGAATAGYGGTATAGHYGTATAGDYGTATAGDWGAATAGDKGTATAGYRGTATAGDRGELQIKYMDDRSQRYSTAIAYIGEDGIKANVPYRLGYNHEFAEVK
jgi:hypothetical protein